MTDSRIVDRTTLIAASRRGARIAYLFFWGHRAASKSKLGKECLSQWWPAAFVVDGSRYASAEHFMMAEKARLFGDEAARAHILEAPSPAAAKALGRKVRGFDEGRWQAARFAIVVAGSEAKFRQNAKLGAFLVETGERVLVEASPRDRIWGIGLAADDPRAKDPDQWRGSNLLGFALMEARRRIT
jgi:ribA/ribD-fused uncharacterized protein